jgi:hypothetical protein
MRKRQTQRKGNQGAKVLSLGILNLQSPGAFATLSGKCGEWWRGGCVVGLLQIFC